MKRINYLFIASVVLLTACAGGFKKGENKSEYKIIKGSGGKQLKEGSIFEFTLKYQVKDTVFASPEENGKQIFSLDSARLPKMFYNVLKQARVGDSVVIRMISDTFFQKNIPTWAKKGQMVYCSFKILNVYDTKEQADAAQQINQQETQKKQIAKYLVQASKDSIAAIPQLTADSKLIEEYLAKNNIKAVKGHWGTYVEILTPGTGPLIDTGMVAKVLYSGHTMTNPALFDSNIDTSFHANGPYTVEIPANIHMAQVVKGWIDGLKLLSKGSKARFYIPSSLGYGKEGRPDKIMPNDNLFFDIEIADVVSRQQAVAEQMAQQQKQQEQMAEAQRKAQEQQQKTAPNK